MFTKVLFNVLADPAIAPYYNIVKAYAWQYRMYVAIAAAVLVLILGFYGQRLFGLVRWLVVFAVGFIAGAGIATPMLKVYAPSAHPILIGVLCGLVLAVVSGFIYNAVFMSLVGVGIFYVCFNAMFLPILTNYTKGNVVVSAGVAVVCIVLALIFRKYAEMALTAGAVGFAIPIVVNRFVFNFAAYVPVSPMITVLSAGLLLSAIMFFWQVKHRVRYD